MPVGTSVFPFITFFSQNPSKGLVLSPPVLPLSCHGLVGPAPVADPLAPSARGFSSVPLEPTQGADTDYLGDYPLKDPTRRRRLLFSLQGSWAESWLWGSPPPLPRALSWDSMAPLPSSSYPGLALVAPLLSVLPLLAPSGFPLKASTGENSSVFLLFGVPGFPSVFCILCVFHCETSIISSGGATSFALHR